MPAIRDHNCRCCIREEIKILVGQRVLGWKKYRDFVSSLAHISAVILLLVIGLEFGLEDMVRIRNGMIASIAGVSFNDIELNKSRDFKEEARYLQTIP